ncbi:MAG TPA: hypothetical protein VF575_01155 [Candidatus Saccharimonadales bacterium]
MSNGRTVSIQVSTAQQFHVAAEARRAAQKTIEASLPAEKLALIAEAQQRQVAAIMPRISSITVPIFKEFRRTMLFHGAAFRSVSMPYTQLNQSITAWQKVLSSSLITGFQQSTFGSIPFVINFETPDILMPRQLEQAVIADESLQLPDSTNLTVSIDQYGNFVINQHTMYRANANTSEHGKLLHLLESRKDEFIKNDELRAHFKAGSVREIMKNLKKDMRESGYRLDYDRHRRQGLVYHGIIHRQQ